MKIPDLKPAATRSSSVPFSSALSFVVKALTSLCKEHLSILNWLSSWTSAAFSSVDFKCTWKNPSGHLHTYHYIHYTYGVIGIFSPRKSLKMRRSAITWLAKDHWPFVACPSFPWRWSDCFSLRGWWLSFPLISSVSSSPITQTPTDGGNEAEDTGYLDSYWRILWLKFQTSETWSDFWNMKHVLIAL